MSLRLKRLLMSGLVSAALLLAPAGVAYAASGCPDGYIAIGVPIVNLNTNSATIQKSTPDKNGATYQCISNNVEGGAILVYAKALMQYLSGLIGLVIVLMIVVSGIQYVTAYGNPKQIASAKSRLTSALIGLFLFIFAFAILSFIVPGGILSV